MKQEINWEKEILEGRSEPNLRVRRMLELRTEAQKLLQVFEIEDILLGIKRQILPEGEIIIKKQDPRLKVIDPRDYKFSYISQTPIGYSAMMSLRSSITIQVPGKSVPVYSGPMGEETFSHDVHLPAFTSEGYHFLNVSTYAGFQDINGTEFTRRKDGIDAYLRSNELKKEGLIEAGFRITPVDEDKRRTITIDEHKVFLSECFDWGDFSVIDIRENLIRAAARYLGSSNLNEATLKRK